MCKVKYKYCIHCNSLPVGWASNLVFHAGAIISQAVTHPSTCIAFPCLTSLIVSTTSSVKDDKTRAEVRPEVDVPSTHHVS